MNLNNVQKFHLIASVNKKLSHCLFKQTTLHTHTNMWISTNAFLMWYEHTVRESIFDINEMNTYVSGVVWYDCDVKHTTVLVSNKIAKEREKNASFNWTMFQRCLCSFALNCVNLFTASTRFKYILKIKRVNKMFKTVKCSFKGRYHSNAIERTCRVHAVLPCVCVWGSKEFIHMVNHQSLLLGLFE